ncbi:MAG: hypothetical protein ACK4NY_21680 [Spirosomataceae bacterium]
MATTDISKNWIVKKSRLLKKFSVLAEDDLIFRDGNFESLLEKLQIKLGLNKQELTKILNDL